MVAPPYSLRRTKNGNLLLYAWETGSKSIKAFSVSEILDLRVGSTPFVPRYRMELSLAGGIARTT